MQWRKIADQLRPKLPKLAAFMDETEADMLACLLQGALAEDPLDQRPRAPQRRDQPSHRLVGIFPNDEPIVSLSYSSHSRDSSAGVA
jgi:putative transposase